jgi:NarL family two-component system response regulator LiaR
VTGPPEPVTVMIVDDHAIVRHGIRAYLGGQADLRVVGEAANCEEAVRLSAWLAPDVVLMDLVLPGPDGIEATRRIRRDRPATQVVVLTSFGDAELVRSALEAGAVSYLLKETHPRELPAAVRLAARGRAVLSPAVVSRLHREVPPDGLSEREVEVLRLVAAGHANGDIARRLGISEQTVKKHVSSILGKLRLADRTQRPSTPGAGAW